MINIQNMLLINDKQLNYNLLDLSKFIFAILIMLAHISSELVSVNPYFKLITSLYNFGVPFFFAAGGFLFFRKTSSNPSLKKSIYRSFTKKIMLMYLYWSLIYFIFILYDWAINSVNISEIISYFHRSLVFTTYGTIWYLPAFWIGISIVYFLEKFFDLKIIIALSLLFYFFGSLGYSYTGLFENSYIEFFYNKLNSIIFTTRNGFFSAFPFVTIGYILTLKKFRFSIKSLIFLTSLSIIFFVSEAYFIKNFLNNNVDMGLLLIPSTFFLLFISISVRLNGNINLYRIFRDYSIIIFLSQRLFITAFPNLLQKTFYFDAVSQHGILSLLLVSLQIFLISYFIKFMSNKYTFFRRLWG